MNPAMLHDKFLAACLGASIGESIGLPAETLDAARIKAVFGRIDGPLARPESEEFHPLPAGSTGRQTEATLAVLKAGHPLPDLGGFAFHIKDAFNRYPNRWPKTAAFPWPPFPDEGHYTFAFALPAAYRLSGKADTVDTLAEWLRSYTTVSIVWQQGTWIYLRLLACLFEHNPHTFDPDLYLKKAMMFVEEADAYFPGDHKIKRRMHTLDGIVHGNLAEVAKTCGGVDSAAENMLAFVGAVFFHHPVDFRAAVTAAANSGGHTGASSYYVGSLVGALCGTGALPAKWSATLLERERVETAVATYLETTS